LNRCCAFVPDLESMCRDEMLKILLQHNRPEAAVRCDAAICPVLGVDRTLGGDGEKGGPDPGCVKTHTSVKCRKYNSLKQHRSICAQYNLTFYAQSLRYFSTRAARFGVFTQPRPQADMVRTEIPQRSEPPDLTVADALCCHALPC
jgi:hypothetical protein